MTSRTPDPPRSIMGVVDYAAQHLLADPAVLFWGPRTAAGNRAGQTLSEPQPACTAPPPGKGSNRECPTSRSTWTFRTGDHGIAPSYRPGATGTIQPAGRRPATTQPRHGGLALYRSTLYAFTTALDPESDLPSDDMRLLARHLLDAFWCHPTPAEARTWGTCPYDSDPAGTATRPPARPALYRRGPDHPR
jgi:hypothetical protein